MKLLILLIAGILLASAEEEESRVEETTVEEASKPEEKIMYDLSKAQEYFDDFIVKYEKTYTTDEEKLKHFEIFKDQLKAYNEKNAVNDSAVFEVSDLADCDSEEGGCLGEDDDDDKSSPCIIVTDSQLTGPAPPTLDYRQKKSVGPVRDQGKCQTCWAFTSVGCIEGAYHIKHGVLVQLAPKQLMDCLACSGKCNKGSTMRLAFSELIDQPGVELEADYPYQDKETPCKFNAAKAKVKVTSCTNFRLLKETKLKEALAKYGPIGIGVYSKPLQGYKGGIVTLEQCPVPVAPERVNHAVLLVGYGKEKGKEYWIIKNSYGTKFGENGYFRLEMGRNVCGMLNTHAAAAGVA